MIIDTLYEAFSIPLIRHAFIAMVIAGSTLSLLGVIIVSLHLTAIRFTLMHVGLLGAASGLALGFSSSLGAFTLVILTSLVMGLLVNRRAVSASSVSGIFMTGSLAGAFLLLAATGVPAMQVFDIFAGNILMMTRTDVLATGAIGLLIVAVFATAYREIQLVLLDRELAVVLGVPVQSIIAGLFILLGLGVATVLRLVGALLVDAIILLPAMGALRLARGFGSALLLSSLFGFAVATFGFLGALLLDLPVGASAAMVSTILLGIVLLTTRHT